MNCSAGEVKAFTSFRATCNDLAPNITGISTDMFLQKSQNYITMKVTEWTITEETGSLVFFRGQVTMLTCKTISQKSERLFKKRICRKRMFKLIIEMPANLH